MITSQNDTTSISIFLKQYKSFVLRQLNIWPFVKAVVTDWSWALMNSVMAQWNEITMEKYLKMSYNYLKLKEMPKKCTVLLNCCAHIMHRVSKAIKQDFPELMKIKSFLLECFSLLILSRSLKEMKLSYRVILDITVTKKESTMKNDFDYIVAEKQQNMDKIRNMMSGVVNLEEKELDLGDEFLKLYAKSKTIYVNSPFYKHFWKIFALVTDAVEIREKILWKLQILITHPNFVNISPNSLCLTVQFGVQ